MTDLMFWSIKCAGCGRNHLLGRLIDDDGREHRDSGAFCLSPTMAVLCTGCGGLIKTIPDAASDIGCASYLVKSGEQVRRELAEEAHLRPHRN